MKDIFKDVFSTHIHVKKKGRRGLRISVCGKPLCLFLDGMATRGAKNKRAPELIINSKPEVRKAFLEAWIQGDYGVTASEELASDIGYLLLFDDVVTTFTHREVTNRLMPSAPK